MTLTQAQLNMLRFASEVKVFTEVDEEFNEEAVYSLMNKGYVHWKCPPQGYYVITPQGRKALKTLEGG